MVCPNCNNIIQDNVRFCTICGAQIEVLQNQYPTSFQSNATPNNPNKKTLLISCVAILLAIVISISAIFLFTKNDEPVDDEIDNTQDINFQGQYSDEDIPEGAFNYNDHWYYIYPVDDVLEEWDSIEQFCESRNGYLATINSEEENNFIYNNAILNNEFDHMFFGYAYDKVNENFAFLNGEANHYTNWEGAEPSPSEVKATTKYAMFTSENEDSTWSFDYSYLNEVRKLSTDDIASINATSELTENGTTYPVENILDGNHKTAWSEGVEGAFSNDTITIKFTKPICISQINVWNGYHKSEDLFFKNGRISKATLTLDNDYSKDVEFGYTMNVESINLDDAPLSSTLKLNITEIHPGGLYDDTLISDIEILYTSRNDYFICEWGEYEAE